MNRVILIGNLGKDPETKETANGKTMCSFSLATKEYNGEAAWHMIKCFGKTAELASQYLSKGRQVCVEGSISYSEYEGKWYTSIMAQRIEFIGSKSQDDNTSAPEKRQDGPGDELPF